MPQFRENRLRQPVTMTLSVAAIEAADVLAEQHGLSRSTWMETLIREEAAREGLNLKHLEREAEKRGYAGERRVQVERARPRRKKRQTAASKRKAGES